MENFFRTVDILVRGWNCVSFTSKSEREKFERFFDGLQHLLHERKLNLETLFEFKVGFGEEVYRNDQNELERVPSIYFPMFAPQNDSLFLQKKSKVKLVKLKARGLLPTHKKFQRVVPLGAGFGVFGLNTLERKFAENVGK